MNQLRKYCIHGLGLLVVGLGALRASPVPPKNAGHPHDMEKIAIREDVTLDLRIPYSKILYGEIPHIYLGIKYGGGKSLKINKDFTAISCNQLLYEGRGGGSDINLTRPDFIPTWERLKKHLGRRGVGFETLDKGDYRIYVTQGKSRSSLNWDYDITPTGTRQIRVSLLTGENEWVFSDWVPLQRINERKLHESETIETLFKGTGRSRMIKQEVIDGETYLFFANATNAIRIARVPEGATPRFETFEKVVDGRTIKTLVIHFDGVDVPPVVHRVHDIVTLEGTAETTPHLEVLKSLEKTMSDGASNPKRQTKSKRSTDQTQKPSNKTPVTTVEETAQQPVSFLLLWIGLIVIFLTVIVFAWVKLYCPRS